MMKSGSEHGTGGSKDIFPNGLPCVPISLNAEPNQSHEINFILMEMSKATARVVRLALCLVVLTTLVQRGFAQTNFSPVSASEIVILEMSGSGELQRAGSTIPASTNQVLHAGDQLITHANSRITLRWT